MAEKDKTEKVLEDYKDVFADIYNTLLFGEHFLEEDKLEPGATESIYKSDQEQLKEQRRDVLKYYRDAGGLLICSYGIENQSTIDGYMPVRVMGYDYATYRTMLEQEKTISPVITIVLNFTDKRWNKATSLQEMFDIPVKLQKYVADYKIKVFDVAFLEDDVIESFTSDFKLVAKFFKLRRLGRMEEIVQDDETAIEHIEAVMDLFKVFADDIHYKEIETGLLEKRAKGEKVYMCNVVEAFLQKGYENGMLMTLIYLVREDDYTVEKAARRVGLSVAEFNALLDEQENEGKKCCQE